jgi:hypothetical protein
MTGAGLQCACRSLRLHLIVRLAVVACLQPGSAAGP